MSSLRLFRLTSPSRPLRPMLAQRATAVVTTRRRQSNPKPPVVELAAVAPVAIGAAVGWVMIFDATSEPADGQVKPAWVRKVEKYGDVDEAFPNPLAFSAGCVVAFSSTGLRGPRPS